MAEPGMLDIEPTLLQMALAAIADVPKVVMSPATSSLPIWNMPFSSPFGTPTRRMLLRMPPFHSGWNRRSRKMGLSRLRSSIIIIRPATVRDASVAVAAPATPQFRP